MFDPFMRGYSGWLGFTASGSAVRQCLLTVQLNHLGVCWTHTKKKWNLKCLFACLHVCGLSCNFLLCCCDPSRNHKMRAFRKETATEKLTEKAISIGFVCRRVASTWSLVFDVEAHLESPSRTHPSLREYGLAEYPKSITRFLEYMM